LKFFVSLTVTVLLAASAYACNVCDVHASTASVESISVQSSGHDHSGHHIMLDNIVKFGADGNHTAMCGCGMEITVNDKTLSSNIGETKFYACSQGCADMVTNVSDKEKMEMMTMWKTISVIHVLASNAMEKGTKQIATCGCGMEVTVDDHTISFAENGVKLYFCSKGCQNMVMAMSDEDRSAMQAKYVKSD